ncbi:hypothetical protein GBF38_006843, partial [Nibea albiflora]
QWGDCLANRTDTQPSCVPCNHKMAITNNDPVKADRPGQPAVNQIAPLKLGDSPHPKGGAWCCITHIIFSEVNLEYTSLSFILRPPCLDPATLLIANVAPAAVYNNCSGLSITISGSVPFSGIVSYSTIELKKGQQQQQQQQLEPRSPHTGTTVS